MNTLVNQSTDQSCALPWRESSERDDAVLVLRQFIDAGDYAPGDRLPPEREMIGTLSMSRSTLRKALDALEREGAIWRHVGKGTFVAGHGGEDGVNPVSALSKQLTPVRVVQARLCIEPSLAREAAIHASRDAITRIKLARDAARAAVNWADYETQDDLFHRAVAEASDNLLLLALFDQLNAVRRAVAGGAVVRGSVRPPQDHTSFAEHDQIAAAIEARDAEAAHRTMRQHIGAVSARLFGEG